MPPTAAIESGAVAMLPMPLTDAVTPPNAPKGVARPIATIVWERRGCDFFITKRPYEECDN
jgi:hypothetical protein